MPRVILYGRWYDAVLNGTGLFERCRLPEAYRYLEVEFPRRIWPEVRLHLTARRWLLIHDGFRADQRALAEAGAAWTEGRVDIDGYRRVVMPRLGAFLQHLDGHHHIETEHYFPVFAAAEPRMKGGFELLDRDHDAIHGLLVGMSTAAVAFDAAAGTDRRRQADALASAIDAASGPLRRHLHDEEDVIVPQMTLRGDPFERGDT